MISKAGTVDEYIDSLEGDRKTALSKLRELSKSILTSFDESMQYGMPTYTKGSRYYAIASQKQTINIYIDDKKTIEKYKNELGTNNLGKTCIRYRKSDAIQFDTISKIIKEVYF